MFVRENKVLGSRLRFWGNGSDFDNEILENLYEKFKIKSVFEPYSKRCLRTLKSQFPDVKRVQSTVPHVAYYDAVAQLDYLRNLRDRIGLKMR